MLQHRIVCEIWLPVSALCVVLITVFCKRDRKKIKNKQGERTGLKTVTGPESRERVRSARTEICREDDLGSGVADLFIRPPVAEWKPLWVLIQKHGSRDHTRLRWPTGIQMLLRALCFASDTKTQRKIMQRSYREKLCIQSLELEQNERSFVFFFAGDLLLFLNDRIQ